MAKEDSINLVKFGFIKPSSSVLYNFDEKKQHFVPLKGDYDAGHADEEEAEEVNLQPQFEKKFSGYTKTGYPAPIKRYRLLTEDFGTSIEETYFWVLQHLEQDMNFPHTKKIVDMFSASENSAFWGNAQQRLAIQQDRVSQFLATIGKMTKDLFTLVREMRILDERLEPYEHWDKHKSADITLKSIFIDLVEGGTKNPGSVLGLAGQVGFVALPDLFFNTHVYKLEDIDATVDKLQFNEQLRNLLKRKLYQYVNWKIKTEQELLSRRKFTLQYLRQHWEVIQMYMSWIRPNLRNIKALTMQQRHLESPNLITAFDTGMTEIEILSFKEASKGYHPVALAHFQYRTRPTLSFQAEGYQRGPVHAGRVIFTLRAYGWTMDEINRYQQLRRQEELDLLGMMDGGLKAAMDAMGEELQAYLREAAGRIEPEKPPDKKLQKPPSEPIWDPFVSVFKGVWELFTAMVPVTAVKSKGPKIHKEDKDARRAAATLAEKGIWNVFKNYKKSHRMLSW